MRPRNSLVVLFHVVHEDHMHEEIWCEYVDIMIAKVLIKQVNQIFPTFIPVEKSTLGGSLQNGYVFIDCDPINEAPLLKPTSCKV